MQRCFSLNEPGNSFPVIKLKLAFEPFDFPSLAVYLLLIVIDFLLLLVLFHFMPLKLIANHTQIRMGTRARRSLKFCEMQIQLQP